MVKLYGLSLIVRRYKMKTYSLPSFAIQFLNNLKLTNKSQKTVEAYEFELKHFFAFLCEHRDDSEVFTELLDPSLHFTPLPPTPPEITLNELKKVTHWHIQNYLAWIKDEREIGPRALSRKQASIKSLYNYLVRKDLLQIDVTKKLDPIKIPNQDVIAMEPNEVADLTEVLATGEGLTEKQMLYHKYTEKRDMAIILSFLGSGLRLMELQHLCLGDIDFNKREFHIIGKGSKIRNQPFNKGVALALREYIDKERPRLAAKGETNALFLSLQGKQMSRRSIQNLVEKYMDILRTMGHNTEDYSTHKLRATCATLLLRATDNLALVQDYLRHEDPKTTRKYAKIVDEQLRRAADMIEFN